MVRFRGFANNLGDSEGSKEARQSEPHGRVTGIFKEVSIPPSRASGSLDRQTSSTMSSSGEPSEYITPMTSISATPIESSQFQDEISVSVNASDRARELRQSRYALRSRDRSIKRSYYELDDSDDIDDIDDIIPADESSDAALARRLQEEEYSRGTHRKRTKYFETVLNEDASETQDSDLGLQHLFSMNAMDSIPGSAFHGAMDTSINESQEQPDLALDIEEEISDISSDEEDSITTDEDVNENEETIVPLRPPRRNARAPIVHLNRAARERQKLEINHPEIEILWENLKDIPVIKPIAATQPKAISRKLKPFQLEGLDWMIKQEQTTWKGGLLGDEMGMGKTIQAVSLIMSDYPIGVPSLVIVPPVALMQWQNEIKDYTDGKLKVLVYHSSNRAIKSLSREDLMTYDVIMISYAGLESMYRKQVQGWKRGAGYVKEPSVIHSIEFHRLILDEAHNIKSRSANVSKACYALKGKHKWCLSGTPLQNRIGELFSLLRFLEVRPFAEYFCKGCACTKLHWSSAGSQKICDQCAHQNIAHVSVFNQEILNPLTNTNNPEIRQKAMRNLHLLTDRIMLRRLKKDHISSMELPPKDVVIHNQMFGPAEKDFSTSIYSNATRQFDDYVSRGVMLNNYANIFGLLMKLRLTADHPDLILKKHATAGQNVIVCSICDEAAERPIRSRCHHDFCRQCVQEYIQSFDAEGAVGQPDCPRCHVNLSIAFDQPDIEQDDDHIKKSSIINRIKMENWTSSTKIEMLIYDLYKLRSKKQTLKSIVFSQFTSMLQLVEWRLRRAGFHTVLLDGSMSPIQRQKSIDYFMNNVDVEVFLVSLKAGGVALNLTEASRVFIIDPWWNPAAEWQSADRVHRIGQQRPCLITRLVIEDSIESRIVMIQEKKSKMITSTIDHDDVALEKLTPADLQFLFRGN